MALSLGAPRERPCAISQSFRMKLIKTWGSNFLSQHYVLGLSCYGCFVRLWGVVLALINVWTRTNYIVERFVA